MTCPLEYKPLGNTGLVVSTLCFGSLTIGPLQAGLGLEEGAEVISYALEKGINFIDTAESYGNYAYIKKALARARTRVVVATKSYAYTWEGMRDAVTRALDEMGLKSIDIFLLHEQEDEETLRGHRAALDYLLQAKKKGLVKALGLSTHRVKGVMAGAEHPHIEVIHPLFNMYGLGIQDGSAETMAAAVCYARLRGKGIYAMKVLGGGNLANQAYSAMRFGLDCPAFTSLAVGMKTKDEVDLNLAWVEGRRDRELEEKVKSSPRRLHIESWCQGCGECIEHCSSGALTLRDGVARVEEEKCILCGYCSQYCPWFCIKVI